MTFTVSDDGVFEFGRVMVTIPITNLSARSVVEGDLVKLTIEDGKVTGGAVAVGGGDSSLPKPENHWGVIMRAPEREGQEVQVCIKGRVKVRATEDVTSGFKVKVNYGANAQYGLEHFGVNPVADGAFLWKGLGYALQDITNGDLGWVLFNGIDGAIAELSV